MRDRAVRQAETVRHAREIVAHGHEFLHAHADHVTDRSRIAAEPHVVPLVGQSRVVRDDQPAAVRHIIAHAAGGLLRQDVHARQHGDLVLVPVRTNRHDVGGHAMVGQRAEPLQRLVHVVDLLGRRGGVLAGPLGLVVEHHGDLGLRQLRAKQSVVGQRVQIRAQLAHVAEHGRILAGVGHHRGMELLRAGLGLAPLEVAHRVRAHGHMRQGVAHQLARLLAVVDRTPVHRRCGMLHQEPRILARDAVDQARGERELVQMGLARNEVMVVRYEIDLTAPIVVVQYRTRRGHHEVRGQRQVRSDLGERVALGDVERLQRVGAEALEVKQLARVHEVAVADEARRHDFREVVHALRPERRAPRVVHRVDGAVAFLAPLPERAFGVLGIVEAVVAAVLVAHMPCDHVRVALVMLGHRTAQLQRVLAEHRTGRPPMLACARLAHVAAVVLPQHLGMRLGEPHRRRRGRGREVHSDAGLAQLVDDAVKPVEIVHALARLDLRPREDAHGHEVHAGLLHQTNVIVPHLFRPLVGIVVPAVPDTGLLPGQRLRPTIGSALSHIYSFVFVNYPYESIPQS